MSTEVTDYPDVRARLHDLGLRNPSGFAILPNNFDSAESVADLRLVSEAATLKTLLRSEDLPHDDIFEPDERPGYIQDNAFEWVAPTLFIPAALLSENPASVSIALNVISHYVVDFFKGMGGNKSVSMDIVVETHGNRAYKKISYKGPPEGLKDLDSPIQEIFGNE